MSASFRVPVTGLVSALLVAACSAGGKGAAKPTGPVATANSMCPIGADAFDNTAVEPALVRTHGGTTIGFCCPSCVKEFDAMSDADKNSIVALAKANKTR